MSNRRFDGDPIEGSLNKTQPKGRNNREIESEVVAADPQSGAMRPAGKPESCDDSLGEQAKKHHVVQTEFDATESRKGVDDPKEQSQRRSVNRECGDSAIPVKRDRKSKQNPLSVDSN